MAYCGYTTGKEGVTDGVLWLHCIGRYGRWPVKMASNNLRSNDVRIIAFFFLHNSCFNNIKI